jgi:hypothetical protein
MLQNPFYIGIVEWDGVRYPGKHKPLITKNLFERVQEVLKAHNKAGVRQRRHDHYLRGVLCCAECGNELSLTLAKGKYAYFYCLRPEELSRGTTVPGDPKYGCPDQTLEIWICTFRCRGQGSRKSNKYPTGARQSGIKRA